MKQILCNNKNNVILPGNSVNHTQSLKLKTNIKKKPGLNPSSLSNFSSIYIFH